MKSIIDVTLDQYLIFGMTLVRMSGLVVFAPFFGGEDIPKRARIGLAVMLSFIVFPIAAATVPEDMPLAWFDLAALAVRELFVGLVLGFVAGFVFAGCQLAGELAGQQIGFALANVVDPVQDQEVGIISFFKFLVALAIFLSVDLHLAVIRILVLSYEAVGVGRAVLRVETLEQVSRMFGEIWETGLRTGGPLLLVMFMVSVVVGFVSRTMPQFNIIAFGLPARSTVGMLALFIAMRPFCQAALYLCIEMVRKVDVLVLTLAPQSV